MHGDEACLFPPSRAHETDLVKRLFANRPVPEGFDLSSELASRVRSGRIDLEPRPDSGWYDHQTWALEPLLVPETMPEGARLELEESYRRELVGLFRSILALTRETHVKQLEFPSIGAEAPSYGSKIELQIRPDLTIEPLASHYFRRALAYRFVRRVLEEAFGDAGLSEMRRLTPRGSVDLTLGDELRLMEGLHHGAYLEVCEEIGLDPVGARETPDLGSGRGAAADRALLGTWRTTLGTDPDLSRDVRAMVPIFHDIERRKTRAWVVLGVTERSLVVRHRKLPRVVSVRGPGGEPVPLSRVEIEHESERRRLAYVVSAEVWVDDVLDREEFRAHCDRHRTFRAIVDNLR